ncbi:vWA domain-containing protein [Halorhabdus amylolytica]|uniref:vWA domain-containing protein n=1 Tax=Halorhabdus amylolytica TaxID=2559573 RepID=UPI0010A9A531|nr:vWA domain-containing protein [Halorhabdus amylolytica]
MSERYELSRRKVLAGLGTIGLASAGTGLGTTAYFSDEETYENNTLTAGSLDLKVDWEEHYYDGSVEGVTLADDPTNADYVLPALEPLQAPNVLQNGEYRKDAPVGTLQVSSPDDALPIALNFDDKDAFWDTTAIEAFPDVDDDGVQEDFHETYEVGEGEITVGPACEAGADTPADLDPTADGALRTQNDDTVGEESWKPLVALDDVKPGDFGELTLSFHLCDNPGYVWLTGELLENDENSVTEPEGADPDEDQTADDPGDDFDGELTDHIMTRIWYDEDCDNQVDEETKELDMMLAIDTSGSITDTEQTQMIDGINAFIDDLPDDGSTQVGVLSFGGGAINDLQALDTPGNISVPGFSFGGNTPLPAALDTADQILRNDPNARSDAQKTIVVFTDGGPNYQNQDYAVNGYTAPRDDTTDWSAASGNSAYDNADAASGTVSEAEMDETALVAESVRNMTTRIATVFVGDDDSTEAMTQDAEDEYDTLPAFLGNEIASVGFSFTVDFSDLENLATQLEQSIVVGEEVFFLGTLGQALSRLEEGNGVPLDGDLSTAFDELTDPDDDADRECFEASSTHCVGFEWWLPLNHSNQIQTDSVGFDIGFYTEQCRHNTGSGMEAETTAMETETETATETATATDTTTTQS